MSILVALLVASGVFLMWCCSVSLRTRYWSAHFAAAGLGSVCLGVAAGLFYSLFDFPVVWL